MHNDNKKERELELLVIRNIMQTEGGRAFMWRSLQNCCTFENVFSKDPSIHSFNAGLRSHGLWLDAELREADLRNYYLMLNENR